MSMFTISGAPAVTIEEGDMELIFSSVLTASAANITTGTLATGYRDLVIRGYLRSDHSADADNSMILINGDTASANYRFVRIFGTSAPGLQRNASPFNRLLGAMAAGNAETGAFSAFTLTIYAHEKTDNYKNYTYQDSVQTISSTTNSNSINISGGVRRVTDAVTTVGLQAITGDLVPGSSIAVYGVK